MPTQPLHAIQAALLTVALAAFATGPAAASAPPSTAAAPAAPDSARDVAASSPAAAPHQATRSMGLDLAAPADSVFPLFGPVREAEWAPGWEPHFIAPETPAQTADGAVFTTPGEHGETIWVMTTYDPRQRRVAYVIVTPGSHVAELWIQVASQGSARARADVTYRYTALGTPGNAAISHFLDTWPSRQHHWEHAINGYLETRRSARSGAPDRHER